MIKWEIEADGVKHTVECKIGFTKKIIVDGETYKAKSSNAFINLIDYAISFGSTDCRLVVIGNKADLAVNGTISSLIGLLLGILFLLFYIIGIFIS